MKKITSGIVFILTALLLPQRMSSQAVIALIFGDKITTDRFKIGLYFSGQSSWLSNTDDSKGNLGLGIGAYTDFLINEKWTFTNTMTFKAPKGMRDMPLDYSVVQNGQYPSDSRIRRKLVYFELVPMMRYNLNPSWSVAAGPQIGIRTVSKDFYEEDRDDGSKETVQYKTGDYFTRFDIGAGFDLQYAFMKGKGIHLNLRYVMGFTNIYKSDVPLTARNNYVHIGVGIPIGGKSHAAATK